MTLDVAKADTGLWISPGNGVTAARLDVGLWVCLPVVGVVAAWLEGGAWLSPVIGVAVAKFECGLWIHVSTPTARRRQLILN
jgi:hypothetical protein